MAYYGRPLASLHHETLGYRRPGIGYNLGETTYVRPKQRNKTLNQNSINTIQEMVGTRKKYYRRRKKNKRRGRRRKYIPRAITSKTKLIRCKASNYITFNGTSGAMYMVPIQGNSCDDPFMANGTGQPLGYDQWKALYKSAYIIGSKVKFTVHNGSAYSVIMGLTPMNIPQGTTSLANYEYYRELPATRSRLLSPDMDHGVLVSGVGTKKHLAIKNLTDEDDLKVDLVNETAPTKQFYWHVWCQVSDQSTTTTGVEGIVDVEYLVLLTDPIVPARSVES